MYKRCNNAAVVTIVDCKCGGECVLLTFCICHLHPLDLTKHRGSAISLQHGKCLASPGIHIWERYEGFMSKASCYTARLQFTAILLSN